MSGTRRHDLGRQVLPPEGTPHEGQKEPPPSGLSQTEQEKLGKDGARAGPGAGTWTRPCGRTTAVGPPGGGASRSPGPEWVPEGSRTPPHERAHADSRDGLDRGGDSPDDGPAGLSPPRDPGPYAALLAFPPRELGPGRPAGRSGVPRAPSVGGQTLHTRRRQEEQRARGAGGPAAAPGSRAGARSKGALRPRGGSPGPTRPRR